ncbi:glycosyl hydrolase-related protein [Georgenia sp. TF02-10]|uniref:alpha-mannosidase n=1 Tax=Georgenia sp. TF02-10 TaxID=2917725 RepID=UPI001FA7847B|nr:alpha-mannosidase [Georgenia sp. TF02-10]UNX54917.1 glycosyl hydrolase-related protein [Georgenia sp. TF02-10]
MHSSPQRVLDRAERVLRERIQPHVHTPLAPVEVAAHELGGEPVPVGWVVADGAERVDFAPFAVPGAWGGVWTTTWFRVTGTVPDGAGTVELVLDLGWFDHSVGGHVEGLVYRPDGTVVKALHPRNGWVRLTGPGASPDVLTADGSFVLYVEAAANPLLLGLPPFLETGLGAQVTPADDPYVLRSAGLSRFEQEVWELARDVEVVKGLVEQTHDDDPRHWRLARALDAALDAWDEDDPSSAGAARGALAEVLAAPASASAHEISAVGHAHIDSAWLWPVRETRRKLGRTVSNVLALLEAGEPFVYTMSASLHFRWLQERYPDLYERVVAQVRAGRFVPVGGMWVEPDGMMPTGESYVRQMAYGVRDMVARFGTRPREVWLPDSFGYSGALPQLARRAGFRWFLTQKISWNDTTTFPHHSFWWHGIDGTRIFTHFPPADTYAAEVTAAELHHAVANFRDKDVASHSLLSFGYGDGGGGPTREMVARARRFADLEGAPRVVSRTPEEFFVRAEAELAAAPDAPTWYGELYLELHRGTLTSQVAMKQGNRRAESLLRTVEYLATAAAVRAGAPYPQSELEDLWKMVLLNQFHDILPGSSIPWVHRESRDEYADVEKRAHALADRAAAALGGGAAAPGTLVPVGAEPRADWRAVGPGDARRAEEPVTAAPDDGGTVLDNGTLTVRVDGDGHVTSVRDRATGREVVAPGQRLGVLQVLRDEPVRWDAWDLDRHVLRHPRDLVDAESVTAVAEGPAAGVTTERTFGSSRARTTWWLRPGADAVELEVEVDWHEREHLLKLALPLAVTAREALHETQYGLIPRPVHANTAADEAQFETCTHRFVMLEEPGWTVGVVNDGTYGADVAPLPGGTLVRPSLVRSPRFPDPDTDLGRHRYRFAVVAAGSRRPTLAAAATLNAPLVAALPDLPPLLQTDPERGDVVVDWVKLADDGSGDVVARLYEPFGGHARARLRPGPGLTAAVVRETDLLEEDPVDPALPTALRVGPADGPGEAPADGALLELAPFQVATLRFTR